MNPTGTIPTALESIRRPPSVVSSEAIPNLSGEVSPFAREHLASFLSIPNKIAMRVLCGAQRTILHGQGRRTKICHVLQTRQMLRQIQPLIELSEDGWRESNVASFWVPRRAADKKTFFRARQKRKWLPPPSWTGEPRPEGFASVAIEKVFPHQLHWVRLREELSEIGEPYLFQGFPRSHAPQPVHRPSPKRAKPIEFNSNGWFAKDVIKAISRHRWSDAVSSAVFEVLYLERKPRLVAGERGLAIRTIHEYSSRVRKNLPRPRAVGQEFTFESLLAEAIYGL